MIVDVNETIDVANKEGVRHMGSSSSNALVDLVFPEGLVKDPIFRQPLYLEQ